MRQVYQLRQPGCERRARHRARAQAGEVRGFHLAVDQAESPALQLPRQPHQRDLGGVGFAAEHGFAVEHAADRHAVETADQLAVAPGFHRMRVAGLEQAGVGRHHRRGNPGAACPLPWRGAGAHHLGEGGVDTQLEAGVAHALGQRTGDAHLVRHQHHARVGTPPQDRLAGVEPGKDAVAVGIQQALRRQVAAHRQQAVGVGERGLDRGKECGVLETFAHVAMVADSKTACIRRVSPYYDMHIFNTAMTPSTRRSAHAHQPG